MNEEEQIVSADTFTQWAWDVRAIQAGEQRLNLQVTVKVIVDGLGERARDLPVVTKGVAVSVNPAYSIRTFVGAYWQWLATTLLLPFGAWLFRVYAARKTIQKGPKGQKPAKSRKRK